MLLPLLYLGKFIQTLLISCGRITVVKLGAMVLRVVLSYALGETNPNAATNIAEFQQQQE